MTVGAAAAGQGGHGTESAFAKCMQVIHCRKILLDSSAGFAPNRAGCECHASFVRHWFVWVWFVCCGAPRIECVSVQRHVLESDVCSKSCLRPRRSREPPVIVGASALADIFIQCPSTGAPVSTGLKTEWVVLRSLPCVAVPLRCPACGQLHRWKPADAWIGISQRRDTELAPAGASLVAVAAGSSAKVSGLE